MQQEHADRTEPTKGPGPEPYDPELDAAFTAQDQELASEYQTVAGNTIRGSDFLGGSSETERRYQRLRVLELTLQSLGPNVPNDEAIINRATSLQNWIESSK